MEFTIVFLRPPLRPFTGLPLALENLENLEFGFKLSSQGKIREFENIWKIREKSGNFVSNQGKSHLQKIREFCVQLGKITTT